VQNGQLIGDNINATENEGVITLEIDTTAGGSLSASGKSFTLASTRGNKTLRLSTGETVSIGINVYQKAEVSLSQG